MMKIDSSACCLFWPSHDTISGLEMSKSVFERYSLDVLWRTRKLSRNVFPMDKSVTWRVMQNMSGDVMIRQMSQWSRPGNQPWWKVIGCPNWSVFRSGGELPTVLQFIDLDFCCRSDLPSQKTVVLTHVRPDLPSWKIMALTRVMSVHLQRPWCWHASDLIPRWSSWQSKPFECKIVFNWFSV